MNDTVDFILTEDTANGFAVGYIGMVGRKIPAGDLPEAFHCHGAAIGIIIRYDNITTPVQQLYCGVATDIAGPAGQQYIHGFTLPSFFSFIIIDCPVKSIPLPKVTGGMKFAKLKNACPDRD